MERYHSLDKLRAAMMLLGIWLHTVVGYSLSGGWPYKDPHPTAAFDWTLGLIHTFRMPVFMAMAGFFGALLWVRRGGRGFAENRIRRVLLPLVAGWLAVMPPSLFMAAWSKTGSVAASVAFFTSGAFVQHLHPGHLWFLEYLLVLYGAAGAAAWLAGGLPAAVRVTINAVYRRALLSRWRAVLFAVPSAVTLSSMPGGFLEDPPGFLPVPRIVLAYLVPFTFGWLLYLNRDLLPAVERRAALDMALAAALAAVYMLVVSPHERDWWPAFASCVHATVGALVLWLVTFGMTGLFLKYAAAERPLGRYLSDGSYWIYVVHMPVVMACQMVLSGVAMPTELKAPLVAGVSLVLLVASYDLLARPSWIGGLLNGRRYPRRYFVRAAKLEHRAALEAASNQGGVIGGRVETLGRRVLPL
jgi:peptidoglycan/LPS O-acetylase OafA/YrhL